MRDRIRAMRTGLVDSLHGRPLASTRTSPSSSSSAACSHYTGLTAAQVERMKDEFGIYAVSTGRICLAA